MKNKEIQEKRMKGYFIQATKDILKSEGIQSVSVRNIADKAGYSYATLYSYFRDVNDLVFVCVHDFQKECEAFVAEQTKSMEAGAERLQSTIMAYINYFLEYPGIFELFYITRVGDFGNKQEIIDIIDHSVDSVCEEDWSRIKDTKKMSEPESIKIKLQLKLMVVGLLVMYLNRRIPVEYKAFTARAKNSVKNVLQVLD